MKSSIKALFVLALALGIAAPSYAETQNVKVSGSIDAYAFWRANYDLRDNNDASVVAAGTAVPATPNPASATQRSEADSYFRTNTQVEVSADLTDNVSTVINLVNQRDWNSTTTGVGAGSEFDVELDLAYVQMKELFYSPLTLTVGRQDLWFGRGFIVGSNNRAWDTQGITGADEYSVTTAFDAIRATLDFNPWTLDFVYSKVTEGSNNAEDDIDLVIANANFKFSEYNAVAEGYYVGEIDRNTRSAASGTFSSDTETVGVRAQFDPISPVTLGGEVAYQFGDYSGTVGTGAGRNRDAWAVDLFRTYRWDSVWKPELTLEYVHFSGESDLSTGSNASYGSWNQLYRGRFYTAYADFREFLYATASPDDQSATQNQDLIQVKGAMKPLEDLMLEATITYLWTPEDVPSTITPGTTHDSELGWELDVQATYDYTEDVSFGLLWGWFMPGDFFVTGNDQDAVDLVTSVKVSF